MNKFLLLITLILSASCSSVEFSSRSIEKYYVSAHSGSDVVYTKEVTKDFYFWGLAPKKDTVFIEDEFKNAGVFNPSFIVVEQGHTTKDLFFMLITLGLYSPSTYKITLLSNGSVK